MRMERQKVDWDGIPDLTDAFHFSIAWSLREPSEVVREGTWGRMGGEERMLGDLTYEHD